MLTFDGGEVTQWTQGNYTFAIRRFNPFLAMRVLGELQRLLVPAIGGALDGASDDMNDVVAMGGAVGGALLKMAEVVDGEKMEKSVRLLLDGNYISVSESGKKDYSRLDDGTIAAVFTGRPFDLLALCGKIFAVNFMDFSKSSSVPTGVRQFVEGIQEAFRGGAGTTSKK